MSGSSVSHAFEDDILANASNIFLSTLLQEETTTTSRPYKTTTLSSTTTTAATTTTTTTDVPTTTIHRFVNAVTYYATDSMDTNGTWTDSIPGNGTFPATRAPDSFNDHLSNLDLIWIIPIMILIVLVLFGLAFLLFYCIQRTEILFLKYCRCCFRCCKCCRKTSYLLRDEHAKLTDDDTNVLYMRGKSTHFFFFSFFPPCLT